MTETLIDTPTRRLTWDEMQALAVRYRGARIVLRENPGMDDDERYDLLGAVVWPDDPLLGLGEQIKDPDPPEHRKAGTLTSRQIQILTLFAQGLRTRDVAAELGLNEGNVREQMKQARQRMGVSTTMCAVANAMRLGLIS